ncbi:hypothetical protein BE21_19990 [Sorangium cellulosum]|uniref:ParB-like N-terminal domain-containing protein n=1 Tax=Sorangium cellulosum TaxID=56 RepID=A0A150TWX7_SORCE|nr:hypothetical protein BE21_19990 [Sorangium cellulosum]
MSTSIGPMEANFVKVGTVYVPEVCWPLVAQLLRAILDMPTAEVPSTVAGDRNEAGIMNMPTSPAAQGSPTPVIEPETSAVPTTTPGAVGVEEYDAARGAIATGTAPGTGLAPPAAPVAEGAPLLAPPRRACDRPSWPRRRYRRPGSSMAGPVSSRTVNTAERPVMMHAPVLAAECCATCGTPGVCTEAWVCGVCDARFTFHGEPVLSLDGLDTNLAAGGLYCESCDELRPPFERLACTGCSSPMRHIGDVLDHQSRELDGWTWDGVPSGGLRRAPCRDAEEQEAVDVTMSIEGKSTTGNDPAGMLEPEQPLDGAVITTDHRSPRSLHVPSEALPPGVNVCMVAIQNIVIPPNRVPDPGVVRQLKASITELGLLNPIILTPNGELVAGRNRVAAYVELGYSRIEAHIQTWGTIDRKLVEIDENLVRRRLSVLERGRLLALRKEFYEALHPEARQHARGGHAKAAADGATEIISPAPAFSTDAAAKLGTSERTVQEEIRIANDLAPEAAELFLGTPLADEKVKLMELTRLPGEQQAAVARLLVDGRAKSVRTAVAVLQRSASQTDTPDPKPKSRVERTRPAPSGAGGLPSQGEELVISLAVPQGSMMPSDPADARRVPAPSAEDLANTDRVDIDEQEFAGIPRALADVRDKLRRSKPGRMNAGLVSTVREFLTQIDRELRLHEAAATGRG